MQVLPQISACIKFATVSLVKAGAMAELKVSVGGYFPKAGYRQAINAVILQHHRKIHLITSDTAKSYKL